MDAKQFFDTVAEMRKYQKQYERSQRRDTQARRYAKQLEDSIDHEIARVKLMMKERDQLKLDL